MEFMPGGSLEEMVELHRIPPNPGVQEASAHIQYFDDGGEFVRHRPIFGRGLNEDTAKRLFSCVARGVKHLHDMVHCPSDALKSDLSVTGCCMSGCEG